MFFELIAAIAAGLGGAGVVLVVNKIIGNRLPKWLMPIGAGVAMLATTISSEYNWFPRTLDTLPDTMVVAHQVESRAPYRPWTYIAPFVNRFVAIDQASLVTRDTQRMADAYFFARWMPANTVTLLVDCADQRLAALSQGVSFDSSGAVAGADWSRVPADDPLYSTICERI